jgi:hypothetical protein
MRFPSKGTGFLSGRKRGSAMTFFIPSSRTLREGQMIHEKTTVSSSLRLTAMGNDVTLPPGTSSPPPPFCTGLGRDRPGRKFLPGGSVKKPAQSSKLPPVPLVKVKFKSPDGEQGGSTAPPRWRGTQRACHATSHIVARSSTRQYSPGNWAHRARTVSLMYSKLSAEGLPVERASAHPFSTHDEWVGDLFRG